MSDKKISDLPLISAIDGNDISLLVSEGTDYKFAFTSLLQFISDNLTIGAKVSFGTALPSNTTGKNGDLFIKADSGAFVQKISGVWTVAYTLPSSSGTTNGTILYGVGIPENATGSDNDTYISTGTGIFYKKNAGEWNQVFSMQTGPQGPQGIAGTNGTNGTNGFSLLNGTTTPSNLGTGINGDFYINTSTYTLYGPKTAGIWGEGVPLIGTGIPSGGTTGQILIKNSNEELDVDWGEMAISFENITGEPADNVSLSTALGKKADLVSGKVPAAQLPGYVDDVLEFADFAGLPATGETGKIYVTLDDNCEYRWSGSTYIQIVASPGSTDAVPEGSTNKYFTVSRVLSTVLSGVSFVTNAAISATDTILAALGKIQAQLNGLSSIFQAKEDQNLSTTNAVKFKDLEATGIFKAGQANIGTGLPAGFYGNEAGRFLIGWNRSGSEGETVFANNGGTEPYAVGGYSFLHVDNSGIETQMLKLSGSDFAAVFAGRVSPGIIDASSTPASKYLTYNPSTKALESRTVSEVASDIGAAGGGIPSGGTAGQILAKIDEGDGNVGWINKPTGDEIADGLLTGGNASVLGQTITIQPATWRINGITHSTSSAHDFVLADADPVNHRYDIICGDSLGSLNIMEGITSANPVKPNIPDSTIEIAVAYIEPGIISTIGAELADYTTKQDLINVTGAKTDLTTAAKDNLVAAINEVRRTVNELNQDNLMIKAFKYSNYK